MSEVDPLIRRELQWMALGVLENQDIASIVIANARSRRLRRVFIACIAILTLTIFSLGTYYFFFNDSKSVTVASNSSINGATGSQDLAAQMPQEITGLISDYPLTWEQSIGDLGAISKAAGLGDKLGGLTATGLKVQWTRCTGGACPTTWILNVKNNTEDIVTAAPALMIYVDHGPLTSSARPVTVTAGSSALLVFTFPEFTQGLTVSANSTWQWNWFLTVPR